MAYSSVEGLEQEYQLGAGGGILLCLNLYIYIFFFCHRAFGYCSCIKAGYKIAVQRTTILSNKKGHFGPTDRNNQTGQSRSPSKVVPNIPVGLNRKGPFHLISNWNFRNFELNGKHPNVLVPVYLRLFLPLQCHG